MGVTVLALAVAGCSTPGINGSLADTRGSTVTIESIEGAPRAVANRLVRELTAEAAQRQIALVVWGGGATYRLRGYLAPQTADDSSSIAWAWDVYDAGQHRLFRLTGDERAASGRKSWAAADDSMLEHIAQAGMEQLALFMASPPAARAATMEPASPAPSAPATTGRDSSIIAVLDDFRPEAAGVFRLFGGEIASQSGASGAAIPLPPERPFISDRAELAFVAADR